MSLVGARRKQRTPPLTPCAWAFTDGDTPKLCQHELIYALGRYGDVYGPLPFEMFDREAWKGGMLHASHDLVAWAPVPAETGWRDIFALVNIGGLEPGAGTADAQ